METEAIDEIGLDAISPPLSADEVREYAIKDHDRPHHDVSSLISVEEFKRITSEIHRSQWKEGLMGADRNQLKRVMAIDDGKFSEVEAACQ